MEEASAQQQSSAFPAPPFYYQRYTQANLQLLEKSRSTPLDHPDMAIAIADLGFPISALEPPPPVTSGLVWQFGRPYPIQDNLTTLEEQGCEQLYPKGPIDRVKELKKLNHSAVFNFLELVHTLATAPNQFAVKVDQIRLIFINMHHILNEYRPHQARETLRLMMQSQLSKKKQETATLKKTCAELRKQLAGLKALKVERTMSSMDVDRRSSLTGGATSMEGGDIKDIKNGESQSDQHGVPRKRQSSLREAHSLARDARSLATLMDMCDDIQ